MVSENDRPPAVGSLAEYTEAPFDRRTEWATEGDLVRITGDEVDHHMATHPSYIEEVLFDTERFTRMDTFDRVFGQGVLTVSGDQWRAQRGALQPSFTPRTVQSYAEEMREIVQETVAETNSAECLDVRALFSDLTMEVMLETLFGGSDGKKQTISEAAAQITEWFFESATAGEVPPEVQRELDISLDKLTSLIGEMIADRDGSDDQDLLSTLIALGSDSDAEYTEERIRDEMITMLFSAHETTALTLTYTVFLLANAPEVEQRLLAELREVVGHGVPEAQHLEKLHYTEQVINESLRIYCPVHSLFRVPVEDITLGDYTVPEGDVVHLPQWVIHRDDRWWESPTEFRPERFTEESDRPSYSFFPFGAGPRRCLGEHFARAEAKIALAGLVQQFSFDRVTDSFEMCASLTSVPDRPVEMVLTARG
jgi:cytochrome P450